MLYALELLKITHAKTKTLNIGKKFTRYLGLDSQINKNSIKPNNKTRRKLNKSNFFFLTPLNIDNINIIKIKIL